MAVEVALEDDLFFADLNRQISLLIDDDDNDCHDFPVAHFPWISHQGYPGSMNHHPQIMGSQYLYQENSRISKGTGVFIPQSSQPRRKYKQGKRNSPPSYTSKSNNKQQLVNAKGRVANTPAHTNLSADNYATSYINT
ncbi:hypothetical protein SOVF_012020 [Spinacia oleracea]|uniref:Uncharacterized protein n=1 Tax=Spinacia oleracea TaxID=3562 RepID=A0A9R0J5F4_SPIOL|nr:uncharacterized protein LOC110800560 [Spinacia oleracea]KNA24825.1 hypothetical protein SOVF_012020 [Spinacia oleracea]